MNRLAFAASLVGVSLMAATAFAQVQAPQMTPILAGKKFTPPINGQAEVQFTKPVTKKDKDTVVTTIEVKNISNAPIARLQIDESWYDEKGNLIPGGKGVINGLLQPNEVQTVKIESAYNTKMHSNNYNFSHAHGSVKPHLVKSFDAAGKEPAAKTASATTTKKK